MRFPDLRVVAATGRLVENLAGDRNVDSLQQTLLRTVVFRRDSVHPDGFRQHFDVEVPYDVILKLFALRPAVVLTSELGARTLQAMIYRLFFQSSRIIIHADLSEDTERVFGRVRTALRRFLLARADLVVVNGQSGARYIRNVGWRESGIVVIPYATDSVFLSAGPRPDSARPARALLYVGQLIERKGLFPFIESLSRWCKYHSEDQIELTLVGDGPLRESIMNGNRPSNLRVVTKGTIPYKALPDHYKSADLMVFPTLADTWGLVVNEAMAMGLPVLGSIKSQAVTELIEDGVSGWWFDPTSHDDMDRAVDRALRASGETLSRIAGCARARARQVTPEYVAGRFVNAILQVIRQ